MRSVLTAMALLVLSACGEKSAQQGPGQGGMPPTKVDTVIVQTRESANILSATGSLRAMQSIVVRPEVAGKLVRINVAEGQAVKAGTLLFALDSDIARAEYNEALAAVRASERNRPRIMELASKQLISKSDADAALATSEINNAKLASAKARLAKTEIRAPFDGVIGLRQVSVGDYVNAGQALVELVQLNPLEVEFQVPETQISRLSAGQNVQVKIDAFPGENFAGQVSAVAPSVQVAGRSAGIRARLENSGNKLMPGQFAQVSVELDKAAPMMMIPEQAIWPSGEQKMVYLVKAGKAELVPVTLGAREPGWVIVVSGLKVGDEVVTAGQMKLFPGAPVVVAKPVAKTP